MQVFDVLPPLQFFGASLLYKPNMCVRACPERTSDVVAIIAYDVYFRCLPLKKETGRFPRARRPAGGSKAGDAHALDGKNSVLRKTYSGR